jgi:multiple sugar transport system substrate-binding protein
MVTVPTFDKRPEVGFNVSAFMLSVTSFTEHKKEAFQVIATALSEDVQRKLAENVVVPVRIGVDDAFGKNSTILQGKNISAAFALKAGLGHSPSVYTAKSNTFTMEAFNEVVSGKKDVNTALREAEEKINTLIATEGK